MTEGKDMDGCDTGFAKDAGASVEGGSGGEDIVHQNVALVSIQSRSRFQSKGIFHVPVSLLAVQSRLGTGEADAFENRVDQRSRVCGTSEAAGDDFALIKATFAVLDRVERNRNEVRTTKKLEVVGCGAD